MMSEPTQTDNAERALSPFQEQLRTYLRAGYPLLYLVTAEEDRAIELVAEVLADALVTEPEKKPHDVLSDRELQVMCLLAAGNSATEIGAELSLSVKTTSTYRARIMEKLNLRNTADIIRYALERGLVE